MTPRTTKQTDEEPPANDEVITEVPPIEPPIEPPVDLKSSITTAPFWAMILTYLLPLFTLIFHGDFSTLVPSMSVVAAGLATVGYTIYEAVRHHAHSRAVSEFRAMTLQYRLDRMAVVHRQRP